LVTRSIKRLKNPLRISQSMKIVCQLLPVPALYQSCVSQLQELLIHPFPRVRAETAEYFYLVLQAKDIGKDVGEIEDIILETKWISETDAKDAVGRLAKTLSNSL
jgi:hypothetical protein